MRESFGIAPSCTRCGAHRPYSGYTEVKVEGTFKGEHYRYWAVRSNRGLSQCLDSGLPLKHEPLSFMRWQGFDPSVAAAALMAGVGWNPFHLRFSGASELLNFVTPSWRQASSLGLFLQRRSSMTPFPLGMGYFHGDSPGGPWYDRDISSSTSIWPRPPGSLMAPLTQWVGGDGHVPGARCRRTSDYCVSLVTVHVGPTWVSCKGPPTQYGAGHGPPASRSTVGCKPGHDSPWGTITETSVKGSDAINPQGWEKVSLMRLPFLWLPFLVGIFAVQVTAAYAWHTQAYVGRTRVVRRLTGSVRSTRFRLARFLQKSFLFGFRRGFRSCRGAGEGVLFPRQRRAQSL